MKKTKKVNAVETHVSSRIEKAREELGNAIRIQREARLKSLSNGVGTIGNWMDDDGKQTARLSMAIEDHAKNFGLDFETDDDGNEIIPKTKEEILEWFAEDSNWGSLIMDLIEQIDRLESEKK